MTSSPTEMRTTAVTKPAVKTSCHGCSCREDALVNSHQNLRKPRQTTTPTLSGYLQSHPSPNSGYANESYNLRLRAWVDGSTLPHPYASLRAWVDDADTERLPPRHCIRPRERLPASEVCPREHISDKELFQHQALSFVEDSVREDIINTEVPFRHLPTLVLQTTAAAPPFPW